MWGVGCGCDVFGCGVCVCFHIAIIPFYNLFDFSYVYVNIGIFYALNCMYSDVLII